MSRRKKLFGFTSKTLSMRAELTELSYAHHRFFCAANKCRSLRAQWLQRKVAVPRQVGCMILLIQPCTCTISFLQSKQAYTQVAEAPPRSKRWNQILSDYPFLVFHVFLSTAIRTRNMLTSWRAYNIQVRNPCENTPNNAVAEFTGSMVSFSAEKRMTPKGLEGLGPGLGVRDPGVRCHPAPYSLKG